MAFAIKFIEDTFSEGGYWTGKSYTPQVRHTECLNMIEKRQKYIPVKAERKTQPRNYLKKSNVHRWEIDYW